MLPLPAVAPASTSADAARTAAARRRAVPWCFVIPPPLLGEGSAGRRPLVHIELTVGARVEVRPLVFRRCDPLRRRACPDLVRPWEKLARDRRRRAAAGRHRA